MRIPDTLGRKNITRRSRSIPRKLWREGRLHLLPIYWLMMQSDLGREGIEHSGSYRFADHIYRNIPSGRNWLGRWVDTLLLRMPASRAFRQRYVQAQSAIRAALKQHLETSPDIPFRVLAIPCGIPRDIAELADQLRCEHPSWPARIHYAGMDLDPLVLELAERFLRNSGLGISHLVQGNALDADTYPNELFHFVVSTGLGEFLTDEELTRFYRNVHATLADGGAFYTSATLSEPRSERLLEAFELTAHYRTPAELKRLLELHPWRSIRWTQDLTGLQTFAVAEK